MMIYIHYCDNQPLHMHSAPIVLYDWIKDILSLHPQQNH